MKSNNQLNRFFILSTAVFLVLFSTVFFKFFPAMAFFRPDLILIMIIFLAIYRNLFEGGIITLLISYFDSLHSPGFIGGTVVVNILIFLVLNYLSLNIYLRNIRVILVTVTSVVVMERVLFLLLLHFFREESVFVWFSVRRVLVEIPVDIIFSLILFKMLRWFDLYTGVKKEKTDFFSGPVYLRRV